MTFLSFLNFKTFKSRKHFSPILPIFKAHFLKDVTLEFNRKGKVLIRKLLHKFRGNIKFAKIRICFFALYIHIISSHFFIINSSLHCEPSRASHLYTVKYIRAKPYLDDGYSMKWPTAITLVIVLKRSLKEGNGSTKYRAVKNGGQGGPSLSKTFAVTWPSNTTCPPPPPYFQNPLSHIFRPSYGPDVLTTDRRNTESYYDPPRSEQSEPNSITHTIVSSRI